MSRASKGRAKQGDGSLFGNILLIYRRPKGRFRKNT